MKTQRRMLRRGLLACIAFLTWGCDSPNRRQHIEQTSGGGAPAVVYPEPPTDADAGADDSGGNTINDEPDHDFGKPPPPTDDYVLDAETATSKTTGLVWTRPTLNTSSTNGSCILRCDNLMLGGHEDWRAPTLDELKTILVDRPKCPRIDEDAFPLTPCTWFISTDMAAGPNDYSMLSFYSGDVKSMLDVQKETGFACRCVR